MSKYQKGIGLISVIILLVVVTVLAVGAYFLGTKNILQSNPTPNPTPTPSVISTPSPTLFKQSPSATSSASPTINPTLLENIKASIVSKNTAGLESYMPDKVHVIVEATECCGIISKTEAIAQLSYLDNATAPWNFDEGNPIAAQLRAKNPSAFPGGIILGTSANRMLVTFTLSTDKTKIEKIYMAVDYKLHGI